MAFQSPALDIGALTACALRDVLPTLELTAAVPTLSSFGLSFDPERFLCFSATQLKLTPCKA